MCEINISDVLHPFLKIQVSHCTVSFHHREMILSISCCAELVQTDLLNFFYLNTALFHTDSWRIFLGKIEKNNKAWGICEQCESVWYTKNGTVRRREREIMRKKIFDLIMIKISKFGENKYINSRNSEYVKWDRFKENHA